MIKITTWRPDTCECEIEYSWDDTVPQDQRVYTAHQINRACPAHQAIANKVQHFSAVLD